MEYFLLNAHFCFQTSRPLWTYLVIICCSNHTRAVCSDLFCSSLGRLAKRYIVFQFAAIATPFVLYRFGLIFSRVCGYPFAFVYYYYPMFPCLWLGSFYERRTRKESKVEALNLMQSAWFPVSCCSLFVSYLRSIETCKVMRYVYNAPVQVIGFHILKYTHAHSWLFRKRNKILFRAKIYWDIMLSINHIKRTILFVAASLLYSRPVSTQSLGYRPHIWRIHFVVPCCLLALRHCDVEHTVIHNFMRMMEKK